MATQAQTRGLFALAALGLTVAVVATPKKKGTSSKKKEKETYNPDYPSNWDARADLIWELALNVVDVTGWNELPEFLLANAYTESRGNPMACAAPCGKNSARGLLQLRPTSGFAGDLAYLADEEPDLLFDPRWNVALAAWYLYRLRNYGYQGQDIDWLALRRGEALPRLVSDVEEEAKVDGYSDGERSADVRERLESAMYAVGLDESFMYRPAFPSGFSWPGIDVVLDAVGAPAPAAVAGARRIAKASRMGHRNMHGQRVFEVQLG